MKEDYTLDEILKRENFTEFLPGEVCNLLSILFETGREDKDKGMVQFGLDMAALRNLNDFSDREKMIFYYFVANGWSYLHQLTHELNSPSFWAFETPEIENQVINLRKALAFAGTVNDRLTTSQVLTNLGNTFDHVGRFVEAIHYWHKAMNLRKEFGMAKGNLGFGLAHYARVLFDEGHRFLFCQYAYRYLNEGAVSKDVYPEAQNAFLSMAKTIEDRYGQRNLLALAELKDFSLGRSAEEKDYRQWCIDNTLFINPLNDFIYENIVCHDCLFLPTITQMSDEPPFLHSVYNQLKQEFVSARYLYYQSLTSNKPHFSDRDNMQMDTLDYSVYSLSTEKLKFAFRACYSLFDKVAYVVNSYFKLGVEPKEVSFRRVWLKKDPVQKTLVINPLIADSQNWPLRGLYWISKDLVEDDSDFSRSILPEAQEIATIRNFMEHKSFKIVDLRPTEIVDNGLTYQIQRQELEQKVYTLMVMARSAIINLSFAIHIEELKKEKQRSVSVPFFKMEHEHKR